MDPSFFTATTRKKGQHLTYEERVTIQVRLKDAGSSGRKISKFR